MPDSHSTAFVKGFKAAFARGGTIAEADLRRLTRDQRGISDAQERAAAADLLALIRHDREPLVLP
jgi:hypothetical protein